MPLPRSRTWQGLRKIAIERLTYLRRVESTACRNRPGREVFRQYAHVSELLQRILRASSPQKLAHADRSLLLNWLIRPGETPNLRLNALVPSSRIIACAIIF